jgi:hypothetical protein
MPLDQPGSLLSLRLVRIPRLRSNNDAHHFLSSRQDSPIQAWAERYRTLSHRCKPKSGAVMHALDALCAKESI